MLWQSTLRERVRPLSCTIDNNSNLFRADQVVDWTGRVIRDDKRGAIPETAPPILQRLNVSEKHWIELTTILELRVKGIAGSVASNKKLCAYFGHTRITNRSGSQALFR